LSDFLLDLHQFLAHQELAKSLDISIGMPTIFANLAASTSWHISSQKIAQLRLNKAERLNFFKQHEFLNLGFYLYVQHERACPSYEGIGTPAKDLHSMRDVSGCMSSF
jgi:hypothetical protein